MTVKQRKLNAIIEAYNIPLRDIADRINMTPSAILDMCKTDRKKDGKNIPKALTACEQIATERDIKISLAKALPTN